MAKKAQQPKPTAGTQPKSEQAQTPAQPETNNRVTPEIVSGLKTELATGRLALEQYGGNPAVLSLPDNMPEKDYLDFGVKIGRVMEFASWRIGDYVNYGKKQYGYKDYKKIADATGLAEGYLRTCASIADRVAGTYRHLYSMEKFRLLIAHRDENETMEKLVARLGDKSNVQLREMTAGKTGTRQDEKAFLASNLQDVLKLIVQQVPSWDNERVKTFAVLNKMTRRPDAEQPEHEEGKPHKPVYYANLLDSARNVLAMLADLCETAEAEADAARDAANEAHDTGEGIERNPKAQKGSKPEKPF